MTDWSKHINAALYFGKEVACGSKVNYKSFETANRVSIKLGLKYGNEKEPYPCPFCDGWHIGRKMSAEELNKFTDPIV